MNEFEAQVLSDLTVLKTQMNGLMGDGNGGRIVDLERRMERHEQNWQRAKGFLAAFCSPLLKWLSRRGIAIRFWKGCRSILWNCRHALIITP
jgi:hypothetical protein